MRTPLAHVFVTERGGPFTTVGFHHLVKRLGEVAEMPFAVHPHMLRHACGYCPGQCRSRHPSLAGLSRPQEHPAHGALHRAFSPDRFQRLLEGLRAVVSTP